tara:strand:- start:4290 stop:5255 length:966 start_codon:yes stop_codon:yes gene_type:complete
MSNGITGLRGYQQGDLVEDDPGWLERLRERRLRNRQQSEMAGVELKNLLPLAGRQLMSDVIGKQVRERLGLEGLGNLIGSRDITAEDLNAREIRALQDAVLRSMGGTLQDESVLEYADYATAREGEDQYSDVGGSGGSGIIRKFFDPSYSMKATFGQAAIERGDPSRGEDPGDYYTVDDYNFNERLPDPTQFGRNPEWSGDLMEQIEGRTPGFLDILEARARTQGAYGVGRSLGQAYGSPEGEGSRSRVNIGNLEEALARSRGEEQPFRVTRGLGWLRDLFDRDGGEQVAETDAAKGIQALKAQAASRRRIEPVNVLPQQQ